MIRFILACIVMGSIVGIIGVRLFESTTGTQLSKEVQMVIGFVLTSIMIYGGKNI